MSDLTDPARLLAAVEAILNTAPAECWRNVACAACNARRQEVCCGPDGPARRPHAARTRAGTALHGHLWLLAHHPAAVLGADWTEDA